MDLLLVRQAETVQTNEATGDEPALSAAGKRTMRKCAQRLRQFEKRLDGVGSSGLTASWQCAELICATYGRLRPERLRDLEPGRSPAAVIGWLKDRSADDRLALVGDEPMLGKLLGLLVCGRPVRAMGFKRAGACLVRSHGDVGLAGFMVVWALTPSQLRAIKP